tara:strand:- start:1835 stop:2146 length:312 start_codon:yes stop_codon:yes gene_type:complete
VSHFGLLALFDHEFLKFPLAVQPPGVEGEASLHLPCGTAPTSLVEYSYRGETVTQVTIMLPGNQQSWVVALPADEVQAIFAAGVQKLNRVPGGELGDVREFEP